MRLGFLVVNDVNNSTMNDGHGTQYNANNHFTVYGDLVIYENNAFDNMCILAIILALIAVILVLITRNPDIV